MEHCLPGLHRRTAPGPVPQKAAPLSGCGSRFAPEGGWPASAGSAGKPRGPALPGACGLPGEKRGAQPPGPKPRRVLRSTDATHLHHLGLKERYILLHDLRNAAPDTPVRRQTPSSLRSSSSAVCSTSFNSGPGIKSTGGGPDARGPRAPAAGRPQAAPGAERSCWGLCGARGHAANQKPQPTYRP